MALDGDIVEVPASQWLEYDELEFPAGVDLREICPSEDAVDDDDDEDEDEDEDEQPPQRAPNFPSAGLASSFLDMVGQLCSGGFIRVGGKPARTMFHMNEFFGQMRIDVSLCACRIRGGKYDGMVVRRLFEVDILGLMNLFDDVVSFTKSWWSFKITGRRHGREIELHIYEEPIRGLGPESMLWLGDIPPFTPEE